jgi:hypothetical protein
MAVLVCLSEVASEHFAVADARTIVLRCFLVGTMALVPIALVPSAIFAALFDALAETGVRSGSTELRRAAIVTVTIPVATTSILISIVAAVTVVSVTIGLDSAPEQ